VTEDEAQTKWCPFSRLLSHTFSNDGQGRTYSGGYSYNRSPDPNEVNAPYLPHGATCIGSGCMAWRWSEPKRTAAFLEAVQAHMKAQDKPNFNTAVQAVYAETGGQFERVEGACGLAGAVQ